MTANPEPNPNQRINRAQWWLIGVVIVGAITLAGLGFAGSYVAVSQLAARKGLGWFSTVFPIGLDAGIGVLLALDLLLTWLRMRFPLLRPTAWGLTAATIAFNAAAAWPDPIGVGMHGVTPVLFVVTVEAARHAVGRMADITADRHMEPIRLSRWILAPWPTFRLWRRMKLWELRSYDEAVRREQDRLVYRSRLRARYGRAWRRSAPVELRLPLRLTRYGIPVTTPVAPAGPLLVASSVSHGGALESATVAPAVAPHPAVDAATDGALERYEMAATTPHQSATVATVERHDGAPVALPAEAPERPAPAPVAAPKAPRTAPAKRPSGGKRGAGKDAIRALYDTLGRRPLESEMVDELKRIRSPHISRQFANKLRKEIERDHPELAALGSDNVHPLTGTDG